MDIYYMVLAREYLSFLYGPISRTMKDYLNIAIIFLALILSLV